MCYNQFVKWENLGFALKFQTWFDSMDMLGGHEIIYEIKVTCKVRLGIATSEWSHNMAECGLKPKRWALYSACSVLIPQKSLNLHNSSNTRVICQIWYPNLNNLMLSIVVNKRQIDIK